MSIFYLLRGIDYIIGRGREGRGGRGGERVDRPAALKEKELPTSWQGRRRRRRKGGHQVRSQRSLARRR